MLTFAGRAQQPGLYPLPFVRFQDNYLFDNPAAVILAEPIQLRLIHSTYTGILNDVGFNYLDASASSRHKSPGRHFYGLMLYSEHETEVLHRTRAYFRYAWNTEVTSGIKLSAGVHAGFFNYSVRATSSSTGSADLVPDASVGVWLTGKKFSAGLSAQQILQNVITPVHRAFELNRYFIFITDYRLYLSENMNWLLGVKVYQGDASYQGITGACGLELMKNFRMEASYLLKKGLGFSIGIIRFPILSRKGDLHFSYLYPVHTFRAVNASRLEVSLRVF